MSPSVKIHSVVSRLVAQNKKQLIQSMARYAAKTCDLDETKLYKMLADAEAEQSSGIGHGMAIMHLRVPNLTRKYSIFARMTEAVEFDSIDGAPVDLAFLMLSPEDDGNMHLHRLSSLSRLMRNPELRRCLRGTEDSETIYALLNDPQSRRYAA